MDDIAGYISSKLNDFKNAVAQNASNIGSGINQNFVQPMEQVAQNIPQDATNIGRLESTPLNGSDNAFSLLNIPRVVATANQSLQQQNINTPQQFEQKAYGQAPQQFNQYAQNAVQSIPFVNKTPIAPVAGNVIGNLGGNVLKGPTTGLRNGNPLQQVGDWASTVGAVTNPLNSMAAGAIGTGMNAAQNAVGFNGLNQPLGPSRPMMDNAQQSYQQGADFGAMIGPVGKLAEAVPGMNQVAPQVSKLVANPGGEGAFSNLVGKLVGGATKEAATGAGYGVLTGQNPISTAGQFAPYGLMGGFKANEAQASNITSAMHPEDVNALDRSVDILRSGNTDPVAQANARQTLQTLAEGYLPKDQQPDNGNMTQIIKRLQDFSQNNTAPYQQVPGLGFTQTNKEPIVTQVDGKPVLTEAGKQKVGSLLYDTEPSKKMGQSNFEQEMDQLKNNPQPQQPTLKAKLPPALDSYENNSKGISTETDHLPQVIDNARRKLYYAQSSIEQKAGIAKQIIQQAEKTPQDTALLRDSIEHPENQAENSKQASRPQQFNQAVQAYRDLTNGVYQQLKASGSNIGYIKNYYSHIFDLTDPAKAQEYTDMLKQLKAKNVDPYYNEPRAFRDLNQARQYGFTPKYATVAEDVDHYSNLAKMNAGGEAFNQEINNHFPDKIYSTDSGEAPPANFKQSQFPGQKGTYYDNEIHNAIKDLYPADKGSFEKATNTVQNTLKTVQLAGGLFHVKNTGTDYVASQLASLKVPNLIQAAKNFLLPSEDLKWRQEQIKNGVMDDALKHGVTLSSKQDIPQDNVLSKVTQSAPGKLVTKPFNYLMDATFHRLEDFFKLDTWKTLRDKGEINTSTPEGSIAAQKYAEQMNNMFGGQNRTLGQDIFNKSKIMKWASTQAILAPDYQQGRFKRTLSALNLNGTGHDISVGNMKFVPRSSADNYALKTLATRILITGLAMEGIRRAVTGNFSPTITDAIKNNFIDPNYPSPWDNNKKKTVARPPATNLNDIAGIFSDPSQVGQKLDHFFISHLASGTSDALQYLSNQNYYGDKLSASNSPLEKIGSLASNVLPIPAVQALKVQSGKVSPQNAIINELGDRVSTDPNDPTMKYFAQKDAAYKNLTLEQQKMADFVGLSQKNGGPDSQQVRELEVLHPWLKDYLDKSNQGLPVNPKFASANTYNNNVLDVQKQLNFNQNDLNQWETVHQMKKDSNGNPILDPNGQPIFENNAANSQQKALLYLNNPKLQQAEIALAQKDPTHADPLWTQLNPQQRATVLASESALPGQTNQFKKLLSSPLSQSWYPQFQNNRSAYFNSLPAQTDTSQTSSTDLQRPVMNASAQAAMTAKNYNDPNLQAYFTANTAYQNQQLQKLGLPTIAGNSSYAGGSGGGSYGSSNGLSGAGRYLMRKMALKSLRASRAKVSVGKAKNVTGGPKLTLKSNNATSGIKIKKAPGLTMQKTPKLNSKKSPMLTVKKTPRIVA